MKAYKVILPCLAVGLLAGLGIFAFNSNKNTTDSVDQTKLYIGIPKTQDDKPVKLHVTVNSNSGVGYKEYTSEDLKPIAGQDKDIVFLDYASDPIVPVDKSMMTSVPGCFAGGDILPREIRQIYLAEHDGKVAANSIEEYLKQ